jgi:hypothetical protein
MSVLTSMGIVIVLSRMSLYARREQGTFGSLSDIGTGDVPLGHMKDWERE